MLAVYTVITPPYNELQPTKVELSKVTLSDPDSNDKKDP